MMSERRKLPETLKELVRENIEVKRMQLTPEFIHFRVIRKAPREEFFKGAPSKLVEKVQEYTKEKEFGGVGVFVKTFGRSEIKKFGKELGLRRRDLVAELRTFFPLQYIGSQERHMGRGVGGKVLDEILGELKKEDVKLVHVETYKERMKELLKSRGFRKLREGIYVKALK